jgi:hypothetical protein
MSIDTGKVNYTMSIDTGKVKYTMSIDTGKVKYTMSIDISKQNVHCNILSLFHYWEFFTALSGPSYRSGTRPEERLTVTEEDDECGGCFLNHYTDQSMKKVTGGVLPEI